MSELTLSAIVTCYKDEPALVSMHARLTQVMVALGVRYEIIFVNDGSPDQADQVLAALAAQDDHVIAIEHSRNFGSQNAFLSGMEIAQGDAVILLDGDLQDPPELIAQFFQKWRSGYDVVYGRRSQREGSQLLAFCARAFYRVFRRLADISIPLDAGDFALMDRRVVDHLLSMPETDQFLRGSRAFVGFRQTGVDYLRPERAYGRSTHNFERNIWWAKKAIISFSSRPIELLGYAGGLLTIVSFLFLTWTIGARWVNPAAASTAALLGATIALFGSLNLLAVALVGEYVAKVLEEAKKRPRFIRKAIRKGHEQLISPSEIESFVLRRSEEPVSERRPRIPIVRERGS